jgi:MYXO-CTERM domain-containing protein
MKTRFVNVLGLGAVAAATSVASADFVGWTSSVRTVTGGYLVNVFAATNSSTDVLLNVYGGTPGTPGAGSITTNSDGGFKQGAGAQGVWKPSGSQNWTTLDSFLTLGGSFVTTTSAWTANSATLGDPPWNVEYVDTDTGETTTADAFATPSNDTGFTNPYLNSIPATGGVYVAGSSSPARSLASLGATRNVLAYDGAAAAGTATFGMLVGQFFVAQNTVTQMVKFTNMGATLRRSDSTLSQASFSLTVGVPAPGALALLGVAGFASRRRRA